MFSPSIPSALFFDEWTSVSSAQVHLHESIRQRLYNAMEFCSSNEGSVTIRVAEFARKVQVDNYCTNVNIKCYLNVI